MPGKDPSTLDRSTDVRLGMRASMRASCAMSSGQRLRRGGERGWLSCGMGGLAVWCRCERTHLIVSSSSVASCAAAYSTLISINREARPKGLAIAAMAGPGSVVQRRDAAGECICKPITAAGLMLGVRTYTNGYYSC